MKFRLGVLLPTYLAIYICSYYVAYLLRFDFALPVLQQDLFWKSLPLVLAVKFLNCGIFGEWRRSFRYATVADIVQLAMAATVSAGILFAVNPLLFFVSDLWISRVVILIDWGFTILIFAFLRCAVRMYNEAIRPAFSRHRKKRTLVYGADRDAIAILRALQATHGEYQVVGFINPNSHRNRELVAGIRVFPTDFGWSRLGRKTNAGHLLVPSSVPGKTVREIVQHCDAAGLQAHVIPGVHEIVSGRFNLAIRDVTISDLLRREPARLDMQSIRQYVAGRRVLVTGGAGSIGSELCRQILKLQPAALTIVDQSEFGVFQFEQELRAAGNGQTPLSFIIADVTDSATMDRVLTEHSPELVFHAAAYKHVPLMEANPHEAIRNNIFGTKNVIDLANAHGVERFVLISTDKAVHPSSVMGATKLIAEKYLQAVAAQSETRFITVRFGNVLNSQGSVVPTFRRQIANGGPITVTHPEMTRFFMMIPEAVQLVLQAGAIGASGDILILEMGEPVRIFDLAKDMIFLSGLRYPEDIDIVFSGPRPGEKLFEELFYDTENRARQVHEKIYCAHPSVVPLAQILTDIGRLQTALDGTKADVVSALEAVTSRYVTEEQDRPLPAKVAA